MDVQADRRRVPRIPFKATSVVSEAGSTQVVIAQTNELTRFGCFVQTIKPYPKGTRVHVEIAEAGTTFVAAGVVAYLAGDGMGIVFSLVEGENNEILEKWVSRTPRRAIRYDFAATAELRDLGSPNELVSTTRNLSVNGCFIETPIPLAKGSRIQVRIERDGDEFTAVGRVTNNISSEGMGVEFIEMEAADRAILEKWLTHG